MIPVLFGRSYETANRRSCCRNGRPCCLSGSHIVTKLESVVTQVTVTNVVVTKLAISNMFVNSSYLHVLMYFFAVLCEISLVRL